MTRLSKADASPSLDDARRHVAGTEIAHGADHPIGGTNTITKVSQQMGLAIHAGMQATAAKLVGPLGVRRHGHRAQSVPPHVRSSSASTSACAVR